MGSRPEMAVLDGDIILFQAYSATTVLFDEEQVPDLAESKLAFQHILKNWHEGSEAEDYLVSLSDTENFRKVISPEYKAHRPPKPRGFSDLKDWVLDTYMPAVWPTLEADDVLGILATREENVVTVTIDKDIKTVPGLHYHPDKQITLRITEEEANVNWLRQALMGDAVDGYKGIPKVGPKKAESIIHTQAPLSVLWGAYLDAYAKVNLTEEDAVMNARLAYILRSGDYDRGTKSIQWTPPRRAELSELPPEYAGTVSRSRGTTSARPYSGTDA